MGGARMRWNALTGLTASRSRRRLALSVAAVVALVPGMTAAPVHAVAGSGPVHRATAPAAAARKAVDITLVTGDRVSYREDGAGRATATVSAGPGRTGIDFHIRSEGNSYLVVPSDAEADIAAGLVDRKLFDVKYLATNGYADTATGEVPVIVQYREPASTPAAKAQTLPHTSPPLSLPGVNGAGVHVGKRDAAAFWNAVRGPATPPGAGPAARSSVNGAAVTPPQLGQGLARVWLDARVRASDDVSDGQIGAPIAWAAGFDGTGMTAGIIDTGIDQTHPDLEGKVVAAQNFVAAGTPGGGDPNDVTDRVGHGTHVASILAGTGAASGGLYRGVAPSANLIIAKGLDDTGSAPDSWIIAAMQWQAATQHARIVSMSLGGGPSDGTDPLSEAVDNLSTQYGTLFVIAAGNSGPGGFTVTSPGAATAALTVGAVDSSDRLAGFSSRGPRLGDYAVKPEITAPGVDVVAARAAGTSLGQSVGTEYTRLSGTSMATPHVAGAAVILGQQHPDWTAAQLKAALIATAHDGGGTAYEQGGGRVDIGRAVTQTVFDDAQSVSGTFTFPYTGQTLTRDVTYRNTGSAAAVLTLSTTATRVDGTPAAASLVSVSPTTVTVPAGGTAGARLTIEPTAGDPGVYTGALRATDSSGDRLSVPIGFRKGVKLSNVTVRLIGGPNTTRTDLAPGLLAFTLVNDTAPALQGDPSISAGGFLIDLRQTQDPHTFTAPTLALAEGGIYSIEMPLQWWDGKGGRWQQVVLVNPEVAVSGDTTVTFDLNKVVPLRVDTPRPSELSFMNLYWSRTLASGSQHLSGILTGWFGHFDFGAMPGGAVSVGRFALWFNETAIASQATMTITGGAGPIQPRPEYISQLSDVPKFTAGQDLRVITVADLRSGADGRNTLVFVEPPSLDRVNDTSVPPFVADLDLAIGSGAAGVLTDSPVAQFIVAQYYREHVGIPVLWIDPTQGSQVAGALAGGHEQKARIDPQLDDPYEYKLAYYGLNRVPDTLAFKPTSRDLTATEATYHAELDASNVPWTVNESDLTLRNDGPGFAIAYAHPFVAPTSRVEYYSTTGPDVLWAQQRLFADNVNGAGRDASSERGFTSPTSTSVDWNAAVIPAQTLAGLQWPTGFPGPLCGVCRQDDKLRFRPLSALGLFELTDSGDQSLSYTGEPGTEETHLFQGGTELTPLQDDFGVSYYQLPAGQGTYRITNTFQPDFAGSRLATRVATTWTFHSSRPATGNVGYPYLCLDEVLFGDTRPCAWQPLIFLDYKLGLAVDDTVPAGRLHRFTVTAHGGPPSSTARLASLRMWTSSDGGAHWVPAVVAFARGGAFQVLVPEPELELGQTRAISLKAEARDAAGNSVEQTILAAYLVHGHDVSTTAAEVS